MSLWQHSVSLPWAMARKECLTASEAVGLLSSYKTAAKKGSIEDPIPSFFELIAEKRSDQEPMLDSYDAAARGHVLEPYAVQEYNANPDEGHGSSRMFHWDDVLITNGPIGFSPDCMDIMPMPVPDAKYEYVGGILKGTSGRMYSMLPRTILEIKSYSDRMHIKSLLTPKTDLKERYQVAFAMLVLPSISEAGICFYNPNQEVGMFVKWFSASELVDEMADLAELISAWNMQNQLFDQMCQADEFDGAELKKTSIKEWMILQEAMSNAQ